MYQLIILILIESFSHGGLISIGLGGGLDLSPCIETTTIVNVVIMVPATISRIFTLIYDFLTKPSDLTTFLLIGMWTNYGGGGIVVRSMQALLCS